MEPSEFNRIKITDIRKQFKYWKELAEKGAGIDEMKSAIVNLITGCAFQTARVTGNLFRARKNEGSELFMNKCEIDYPKPGYVKKMGRANRAGQPMMYLGEDGRTALFEVRPEVGEYVTISKWSVVEEEYLNLIYLCTLLKQGNSKFAKILRTREGYLKKLGYSQRGIENINYIHNLLNLEFSKLNFNEDENIYRLSVAITEVLISHEIVDGLVYSSIRSTNDFNAVIKPESSEKKLRLIKCDEVLVKERTTVATGFLHKLTTSNIDEKTGVFSWTDKLKGDLEWNSSGTKILQFVGKS